MIFILKYDREKWGECNFRQDEFIIIYNFKLHKVYVDILKHKATRFISLFPTKLQIMWGWWKMKATLQNWDENKPLKLWCSKSQKITRKFCEGWKPLRKISWQILFYLPCILWINVCRLSYSRQFPHFPKIMSVETR